MSIQHLYPPQRLALTIALVLGCADVSMAGQPADPPVVPKTTADLQAQLKTFAEAVDTTSPKVTKPHKGVEKLDDTNDLALVGGRGKFNGAVDGGGGTNMLRLEASKGGKLEGAHNFEALHVAKGEWEHTGNFTGWGVIEPETTLINTGHIDGQIGVLGTFDNKGVVANNVIVEQDAGMSNSGAVNGAVHVLEKASFSGNGSVGFLSVAGQLKVGPEVGAPSISGNLELFKGAELIYGIDAAGASATVNVAGTATLNDATLRIDAVQVEDMGTSEHTVIRAKQIEGAFGTIINNLPFMTATPHYSGTEVGLTYARNGVPLNAAAKNENAERLAGSIKEPQTATPLPPKPVDNGAAAEAPTTQAKVDDPAQRPRQASPVVSIEPKPTSLPHNIPVAKPNAAINALLGSNLVTAADGLDQLSGYDTADLGNATLSSVTPISTGMLAAMGQNTPQGAHGNGQVWVQAIGNSGRVGRHLDDYALKHSTTGLLLGTDWAINPTWRLGIIGAKSETRLDGHRFEGRLDSWHVGAYALRQDGPLALRLGAVYGDHDGSTKRHVAFNGFSDRLKGRYDANTQQVFGQVGYNLDIGHFDIEPYVQVGYQRYQRDHFTEKGGDAALRYNSQAQENYTSELGLHLARPFVLDQGARLTPRLNVGWKHLYGDVRGSSRQRLVDGGMTYTVEGIELDRDSLLLEAGLDLAVSPRHTLGVSYKGETGQDNRNGALMGQWRMMF
ncbi:MULTISPECIES: autotransporter domain-containing protein [unclassified Pseudomonas]|uniref:autotransporter outer membrane beta-barrel domain-containing protein n=1 Tax=unclassified Pseudomonas TaxID=196821 RepID=UPI0008718C8C|nr:MULTISPECIES: autotransporter domain-containing protein [unclassified Pseudomonas]SCW87066.1 outer membrane autotransporter barrel domain-containing protein [Pseudomonas sp. NFACC05-1]SFL55570.1 outer membrane autotransporter barrel domain-containing protein [Pseudomonas sp. NFACC46-3]